MTKEQIVKLKELVFAKTDWEHTLSLLGQEPSFRYSVRSDVETTPILIHIDHPLMDYPGAEVVLLKYRRKNRKKIIDRDGKVLRHIKRGWSVYSGPFESGISPFIFSKCESWADVRGFVDRVKAATIARGGSESNFNRHFGVALRIPNPDWPLGETSHRNGIYKGIPESLWGPVLRLDLASEGIGIK